MQTTDELGVWDDLGTLTTNDAWQLFPNSSFKTSTIRLTFNTDWTAWNIDAKYRSYGLIRLYYPTTELTVSKTQRIYVNENRQIITLSLAQLTEIFDIGIKRVVWAKTYYKAPVISTQAFTWSVKIESLLGNASDSEQLNRIESKIDDLTTYGNI